MSGNELFYSVPADRLIALTIYGEARNQGAEGMIAVANVIYNRARYPRTESNWFSNIIYNATGSIWHGIILAPKQFSAFNLNDPVRSTLVNLVNRWDSAMMSDSKLRQAYDIGLLALSGQLADNTYGATHYYNPAVASPTWAVTPKYELIGSIRNHVFHTVLPLWQRTREAITAAGEYVVKKPIVAAESGFVVLLLLGAGIYMFSKRRI